MKGDSRRLRKNSLVVFCFLFCGSFLLKNIQAAGVQSNFDRNANTFAGGLFYHINDETVYVTGLTSKSCFVAAVYLSNWDWDELSIYDPGADAGSGGDAMVTSMCQAVTLSGDSQIVVGGNAAPTSSIFADGNGNSQTPLTGFAALLDFMDVSSVIQTLPLLSSDPATEIEYPQFLARGPSQDKSIYSISLTSLDDTPAERGDNENQNWLNTVPYGSVYDMTVRKMTLHQDEFLGIPEGPVRLETVWEQEFPFETPDSRVRVGGVILKQNRFLAVVGSTRGQGEAYGPAEGNDEDGFITLLDLEKGNLLKTSGDQVENNIRIGTAEDDVVMGVCDHPTDPNAFFIVGATQGTFENVHHNPSASGSLTAFVSKMDTRTLTAEWTRQLGARMNGPDDVSTVTGSFASGCAVVGRRVFVGGGVQDNARMWDEKTSTLLESKGGDDIWVASLNTDSGITNWIEQIGSAGQERLSNRGGIAADAMGNVIVYGDTTGSMYRQKQDNGSTDVFLMLLNGNTGKYSMMDDGSPVAAPTLPPLEAVVTTAPPQPVPTGPFAAVGDQLSFQDLRVGGMSYDARNQQAWLAGAMYDNNGESKCFITKADLRTGRIQDPPALFGKEEGGSRETCSAIAYAQQNNLVYAVGDTPQDGFLVGSELYSSPKDNARTFGLMLQVDASKSSLPLMGAAFERHEYVNEPIQIVLDPNEEAAYVIHMSGQSQDDFDIPAEDKPKFAMEGTFDYGQSFKVRVVKYQLKVERNQNNVYRAFYQDWTAQFWVDELEFGTYPTGIVLAGNAVVVVGSTRGTAAEGIINGEYVESPFGTENPGNDMDGYIFRLDVNTGDLLPSASGRTAARFDSSNSKDDWVLGLCADVFDQDSVYVVGASEGKVRGLSDDQQPPEGTIHAFVTKVDLDSLNAEWLHHFTMSPNARGELASGAAYSCAVTNDNLVYVAGFVENGATMDGSTKTDGADKDDIFVAQMDAANGRVNWIRQVGTPEDERLAHNNGISVDDDGNAIISGSTAGNFYRQRASDAPPGSMDAIVFTMSKEDGSYKELVANGGAPLPPGEPDNGGVSNALPDIVNAFQTGPENGPSYAGGMDYDRLTNTIHVTGETYGSFTGSEAGAPTYSNCFYGSISLPRFQFRGRNTYGSKLAPEACSSISMTTIDNSMAAVVVGTTEEGGLLTKLGTGKQAAQYGFALDLANVDGSMELQGGAVMDDMTVQYPTVVETSGNYAWVASMVSSDNKITPDFEKSSDPEFPNLTRGGIEKYGSKYRIVIEKFQIERTGAAQSADVLENSLQRTWRKPFETANDESIYLSDMITVAYGSEIVLVGSTLDSRRAADMDGIMARIDPEIGNFVKTQGRNDRSVAYFKSVERRDDWILGACTDPDDPRKFYIVGSTQGKIERDTDRGRRDVTVHAVVAKISLDRLESVWTHQFTVKHASGTREEAAAAVAFGCDVIRGSGEMYVAGNVENGAVINGGVKSAGRDDIFVAKILTKDGHVRWIKQVGSNGDDRIARSGGVKADANGNAVVFGDTNGSFFRERTSDGASEHFSDLFMMIFNRPDGSHSSPVVAAPIYKLPHDTGAPREWFPSGVSRRNRPRTLALGFSAMCIFLCALCFYCSGRRRARKQAEMQKASVFAYLQQFDVEDIDLRKSPPGGWHGTYLHKLAYGVNKADPSRGRSGSGDGSSQEVQSFLEDVDTEVPESSGHMTHSSIVRDSLFMDTPSPNLTTLEDTYGLHGDGPEDTSGIGLRYDAGFGNSQSTGKII